MKTTIALAAIVAAAVAAPVFAQEEDPIALLARECGLTERKVQMIVGNRTSFAEYRRSYNRSVSQFKRTLGEDNYQRLISGQPLLLPRSATRATAVAVIDEAPQPTP